ncbi:MAG: hypothetical protein HY329_15675 [Chloroflexi bacterium]|nr:hypothetical protein [Chloroflexota bacterium]
MDDGSLIQRRLKAFRHQTAGRLRPRPLTAEELLVVEMRDANRRANKEWREQVKRFEDWRLNGEWLLVRGISKPTGYDDWLAARGERAGE